MRFFLAALLCLLAIGLPGSLRAEDLSPGVPPIPNDSRNIIRITWSEAEHAATIEIDHQKFTSPNQISEVVRARLKTDPTVCFLVLYKRVVPLAFVRATAIALRDAGANGAGFSCDDATITTPPPKDIRQAETPVNQTIITVHWIAAEKTGRIEIDHQNFKTAEEIVEPLQAKVKADPSARLLVRADRDVAYPFLKEVMIAAGKAGVGKVTFSVIDNAPPSPAR